MCGIISYLGKERHSYLKCLNGLKQLQNRGYDSAGICSFTNKEFVVSKYASSERSTALEYLGLDKNLHDGSQVSIGHTRWATHGAKTDANSHPHVSSDGIFALCHNGIIENFDELRNMLLKEGFSFSSQTDTEVAVNLIAYHYRSCQNVKVAINQSITQMEGSWALAIMCMYEPNALYATRKENPILIAHEDGHAAIASEQSGFCGEYGEYFILQDLDICKLELSEETVKIEHDCDVTYKPVLAGSMALTPDPWDHWTIREIYEQPEACLRAIGTGSRMQFDGKMVLKGLDDNKEQLRAIDHLIILGCGTSYNAGMIGVNYFKELVDFHSVQLYDGADFSKRDISPVGKTALLLLSQSGETKDLHRCIHIGRTSGLFLMGIVNVEDSLIAREVDCGCYLNAGREVGVASTKAYTNQLIVLGIMAIWFAQSREMNEELCQKYVRDLRTLYKNIKRTIEICEERIPNIVKGFDKSSCFILGKGNGESTAKEGALKIKEISYIHAEGYSTSSLKHGPFAMLYPDFPVVLVSTGKEHVAKNENAYQEIKSRDAAIIYITDHQKCPYENAIIIPQTEYFQDVLSIIPLQILAYQLSLAKGYNPDMPRNLAKVVTVE